MATETASCARELEIEIPAEVVERETQRVTREFARVARLPGFRPGKAPPQLVRQRFRDDIRGEVLHSLVPSYLENAFRENNLSPVGEPAIRDLEFEPQKPLRFRATFEVLPEIELGDYKGLEVEPARIELTEKDVEQELEGLREQAATFEPIEGRPAEDGDTVVAHLTGVITAPAGRHDPIVLEDALVHVGAETTLEAFSNGLRGASPGEERQLTVTYPEDYGQRNLAGHTVAFTARVKSVKRKKLPALDDDFARQAGNFETLEALKAHLCARLEEARAEREKELTRQRLLEALLARHDFPVPEVLVERHVDARLERQVRGLMAQGIDPRRVDVDWSRVRRESRAAAVQQARLGLLLERIAEAENITATDAELDQEIERQARLARQTPDALRARLTTDGRLDTMKSAIRSEKVVDFLASHAWPPAPGRS